VLASLLIAAGVGGPIYIASRISAGVREQVVVDSPNAASFALWADNRGADAPAMFYEWRFFNVVNADDYEAGRDAHLRLDEVGPYVYREFVVRSEDLVFSADRTKAEYTYWEFYQFDRNRTAPHLDPYADRLTLVNVPLLSVLKILAPDDSPAVDRWWQMLVFDLIASATNASLFVRDLAPNASAYGYTDPTLVFLRRLVPDLIPFVDHGLQVNDSSPAAAKARNQSMGTYTGADDLAKAGSTFMFNNYEQHLDCWATADANRIVGCDGFQCAPDIALGDQRLFWLPPLYRPLSLTTNETYTLEGVEVNRFYVDPDNFFNASLKPANAGFYMFGPSGVGNLTADPELAGAPVYISNPRFYLADPRYTESIVLAQCDPRAAPNRTADGEFNTTGMCPDPPNHVSWVGLEPLSGLLFGGAKRLQVNVQVPDSVLLYWPHLAVNYMPVAWITESGQITAALAQKFHAEVYGALLASTLLRWVGCIVGGLLFIVAAISISVGWTRRGRISGYSRLIVNH
jgi:hypothetical protein